MIAEVVKAIPFLRHQAYVTTNEVCSVALCYVRGFDDPIRIEIHGIKDRRTNQYREFEVVIKAPPEMRARFQKVAPVIEKIVIPHKEN